MAKNIDITSQSYEMEHLINDIEHCKIISEELVEAYKKYE